MIKKTKHNFGLTLVETIFYVAIFSLLSIVVIDALLHMTKSFRETSIQAELMQGADIMEKISREIKQAESINTISSTSLKINTRDEFDAAKTETFSLSGSDLQFSENDILTGNLNTAGILVSNLNFTSITTATSTAVKIYFSIGSTRDSLARTYDFYNTVILRGSY